ncbi:hypothetical protein ACFSM5_14490 [Lacibacterium aquatile]|uniref:Uncharacterized protein n=1 Tax=Lacibacterium aquatile TaxID=1168082 RepID=A0ABW5DSQ0_9PROT
MKRLLTGAILALLTLPALAQQPADKRSLKTLFEDKGSFERLMSKAINAGNWESTSGEAVAIITGFADKTAAYLDETGRISEITEIKSGDIGSPLTNAISMGLIEVLEVYLRYPEVRAKINEPLDLFPLGGRPRMKVHAWALAAAAPAQGASFCGGEFATLVFGYGSIAPYLEARPGETPYRRVLTALEAAGATPQAEEARAVWRFVCGPDNRPDDGKWQDNTKRLNYAAAIVPGSRERVLKAPQMLDAIEMELRTLQTLRTEGKVPFLVFPNIYED